MGRRVDVHLDEPVAREHVRAGVGHARRRQRLLRVLLVGRRLRRGLVNQRGEPAVAAGGPRAAPPGGGGGGGGGGEVAARPAPPPRAAAHGRGRRGGRRAPP